MTLGRIVECFFILQFVHLFVFLIKTFYWYTLGWLIHKMVNLWIYIQKFIDRLHKFTCKIKKSFLGLLIPKFNMNSIDWVCNPNAFFLNYRFIETPTNFTKCIFFLKTWVIGPWTLVIPFLILFIGFQVFTIGSEWI